MKTLKNYKQFNESSYIIKESFHMPDGTPIPVDNNHMPIPVKPSIFTYTTYRFPTDDELKEFERYPHLTEDDIIQGFGYTIIGRGISSKRNKEKVLECLKMLSDKYPDNEVYRNAYEKYK